MRTRSKKGGFFLIHKQPINLGKKNKDLMKSFDTTFHLIILEDFTELERSALCNLWGIVPTGVPFDDTRRLMYIINNEPQKFKSMAKLITTYIVLVLVPILIRTFAAPFVTASLALSMPLLGVLALTTKPITREIFKDTVINVNPIDFEHFRLKETGILNTTYTTYRIQATTALISDVLKRKLNSNPLKEKTKLVSWLDTRFNPLIKADWVASKFNPLITTVRRGFNWALRRNQSKSRSTTRSKSRSTTRSTTRSKSHSTTAKS